MADPIKPNETAADNKSRYYRRAMAKREQHIAEHTAASQTAGKLIKVAKAQTNKNNRIKLMLNNSLCPDCVCFPSLSVCVACLSWASFCFTLSWLHPTRSWGCCRPSPIVMDGPLRQWWLAQSPRGYAIKLRFNAAPTDEQWPIYKAPEVLACPLTKEFSAFFAKERYTECVYMINDLIHSHKKSSIRYKNSSVKGSQERKRIDSFLMYKS